MMSGQPLSIRNILLTTISTLIVLIAFLTLRTAVAEWKRVERIGTLREATLLGDSLFEATDKLSVERDIALSLLNTKDPEVIESLRADLADSRKQADAALGPVLAALKDRKRAGLEDQLYRVEAKLMKIQSLRDAIAADLDLPEAARNHDLANRWFAETTALIGDTQGLWMAFIRHFTDIDSVVTMHMRLKYFLGVVTEYSGRQRSLIGRLLAEGARPTSEEQADLLRWQGMIDLSWQAIETLAEQGKLTPDIRPYISDAESHYANVYDMVKSIFYAPSEDGDAAAYLIGPDLWLALSTETADSLYALKDESLKKTRVYVTMLEEQAERSILIHLGTLLLAAILCSACLWVVIYRVLRPINDMVNALLNATEGKQVAAIPPANQNDEIGKLSRVLHTFQQNTAKLQRYTTDLERSNRELDDFAYIASHDLKEPLRGIHNHSRFLLEDNEDQLSQDSKDRLNRLLYLTQRMEKLINDLLYFSRLGRQELAVVSTDMNEVVHDVEKTLETFLHERNAKILLPKQLPVAACDRVRITEVFLNLVINAVKYNDNAEKIVEIGFLDKKIDRAGKLNRDVFYVKDNGVGIPDRFHEEVFRIFKRLHSSKSQEEGTGVGLTFVKKIISCHGGKIWFESEPGRGTTFYFTLEYKNEEEKEEEKGNTENASYSHGG